MSLSGSMAQRVAAVAARKVVASPTWTGSSCYYCRYNLDQIRPAPMRMMTAMQFFSSKSKRGSRSGNSGNVCNFSSSSNSSGSNNEGPYSAHPQDFVNIKLEPGEWDVYHKDPLFLPPWNDDALARVINADDYAKRPAVPFDADKVESLHDQRIMLSWMDHKTFDAIYHRYCELMMSMVDRNPNQPRSTANTSHEYVMRVLGQEFKITADRAAVIVRMRHEEEQVRKNNPEEVDDEFAEEVDMKMRETIAHAYGLVNEVYPERFVEEIPHYSPDTAYVSKRILPDVYDGHNLWKQAMIREAKDARMILDSHIYETDIEDTHTPVKITRGVANLMKARIDLEQDALERDAAVDFSAIPRPQRDNGRSPPRERSKFIGIMIDTRKRAKPKGMYWSRYKTPPLDHDIVLEQGGTIRPITKGELRQLTVKPYLTKRQKGLVHLKQAWIDKIHYGKDDAWGVQTPSSGGGGGGGGSGDSGSSHGSGSWRSLPPSPEQQQQQRQEE